MRSMRLLFSLPLFGLMAMPVEADGVKGVALPGSQPSVAVSVERGVRVWRPLGTNGGGETGYPRSVSLGSGGDGQVQYVTPAYGVTGIYGGYGGYGQGKTRDRWNGVPVSRHGDVRVKGWPFGVHGTMKPGHSGGHLGGVKAGGPKHIAFVVKGGGGKRSGGHRGHH